MRAQFQSQSPSSEFPPPYSEPGASPSARHGLPERFWDESDFPVLYENEEAELAQLYREEKPRRRLAPEETLLMALRQPGPTFPRAIRNVWPSIPCNRKARAFTSGRTLTPRRQPLSRRASGSPGASSNQWGSAGLGTRPHRYSCWPVMRRWLAALEADLSEVEASHYGWISDAEALLCRDHPTLS